MQQHAPHTAEGRRLAEHRARTADWKRWGAFLSERAWGTVREDYSRDGDPWTSFPHDHARSRAYRWNEDGLAGVSDRFQYLCMSVALWNGRDPILKERLFGLSGTEGNHGEDVKELYEYTDATPTHSYLRMRYAYPIGGYPYDDLVARNASLTRDEPEYELWDTGAFDEGVFDVDVEWAKESEADLIGRITVTNRSDAAATCHVLPTVWMRNTWSWGRPDGPMGDVHGEPSLRIGDGGAGWKAVEVEHPALGAMTVALEGDPPLLFTDNVTNRERLHGTPGESPFTKDAFHRHICDGQEGATNPDGVGTKAAGHYVLELAPGETATVRVRITERPSDDPFGDLDDIVTTRVAEADEFYSAVLSPDLSEEDRLTSRRALAGMVWSQQLYYYDVEQWLAGDPAGPDPHEGRRSGRNADWAHLNTFDILSMPDVWEYPWFAAWDLAFHTIPLALIDPLFAKRQIRLLTREWYQHPNGQVPAYEWSFGDTNPPVLAWAARRVYEIDAAATGEPDVEFLEGVFHKLLLDFTWWVNRKDADENNVFQGGFLGLDNISLFDRSDLAPGGGHVDQSDGTAWMAFSTLQMLHISLELARHRPVYQGIATKFYEHFLSIAEAMVRPGHNLWDEDDRFFYDVLRHPDGRVEPLRVRSLVGLIPLLALAVMEEETLDALPDFRRRMRWFTRHRPRLAGNMASTDISGQGRRILLSVLTRERLESVLSVMLDENEFLGPYGIRSLSRVHEAAPYTTEIDGEVYSLDYEPGESRTGLKGGNSNWRGPVWMPLNYLLIEALLEYERYYGDDLAIECPSGSGRQVTLGEAARDVASRVIALFRYDGTGVRPIDRSRPLPAGEPFSHMAWFPEYFHAETGAGLGASHQTGWTGLIADLIGRFSG